MATQHETDAFKVMQEDVAALRRWVEDHREEHTADTKLLSSIIEQIHGHQSNHHGRTSVLKQAGGVTAIAALAVAAAEIARIFLG